MGPAVTGRGGMRRLDSIEDRIDPISLKAQYSLWLDSNGDTNEEQLDRLKKNLGLAIDRELTETQRKYINDFYFKGLSVTKIAEKYAVNKSTVSRTLMRARRKLERVLKYSL